MGKPKKREQAMIDIPKELLKGRFKNICEEGTPVLLSYSNTILGIGDVLFFSVLLYKAILVFGLFGFVFSTVTIVIGSMGTIYLLTKISPLPGLPIPVFLTLALYGVLLLL